VKIGREKPTIDLHDYKSETNYLEGCPLINILIST
jgi:hypothetical protein